MQDTIYLDYNATAPLAPEARDAMLPWLSGVPANPGAVHAPGQAARAAIEAARAQVAELCGGGTVVFTSGGTEADNLALAGRVGPDRNHVVVSSIEHPAVLAAAAALQGSGTEVTVIDVDEQGVIDPARVVQATRPDTAVVSVMAANNETGTVQPIARISERLAGTGVPLHTDAVQAAAWLDLPTHLGRAELATLAAHKIGGPVGIGALVLRAPLDLEPQIHGGGQQAGRRPGTEPVALAVGMGAACARAAARRQAEAARIRALSSALRDRLLAEVPDARATVADADCLPNTVHIGLARCPGHLLVARLDLDGIAVSSGSACASGVAQGSHVLAALSVPAEYRDGALRISLGYDTTEAEVVRAAAIIPAAVRAVRDAIGVGATP